MLLAARMPLPELPKHTLMLVSEQTSRDPAGFLRLRRMVFRIRYADGSVSEPFSYDAVDRQRLDAVVVAAHFRGVDKRRRVLLRSCLRPPLAVRPRAAMPVPEKDTLGALWELPAGLVEVDERSAEGLRRCAARELLEEVGAAVSSDAIVPLGPSSFPAPGIISERHFFFHVEIDAATLITPTEDGSPLDDAPRVSVPLDEALDLVRSGAIEDEKTELLLRRAGGDRPNVSMTQTDKPTGNDGSGVSAPVVLPLGTATGRPRVALVTKRSTWRLYIKGQRDEVLAELSGAARLDGGVPACGARGARGYDLRSRLRT